MNDEELPLNDERASAYLDNELDPVERASASADPEVMATVESFARVQAALGEIGAVPGSAKNAALAAALAEFDTLRVATSTAAAKATVTSLQSRRRTYRAMTGVAAAIAVLAIGIAAINSARGRNDSASTAVQLDSAPAAPTSPAAAEAPALKVATDSGAQAGTAASSAAATVAAATASGDATAIAAAAPPIDTDAALVAYAARVEGPAPQSPTTTVRPDGAFGSLPVSCLTANRVVVGGPITVNGTPAFAVRNTATGVLQAIAPADCAVLLDVPGP